jgi:membrane protein implicated in regulation of membrane protease activity
MTLVWWHWAVSGIVLILAELALPAFVVIWFGLGALLVAALVFILPDISLTAQLAVWLIASAGMVWAWFKLFRLSDHKTRIGMSDAYVVGEIGVLSRDVAPFSKGEVRFQKPVLGSDCWPCVADEDLRSGERVKILAVEGSLLKIGRA